MRLTKGKDSYRLPPMSRLVNAHVVIDGMPYAITLVDMGMLQKMRQDKMRVDMQGVPIYAAHDRHDQHDWLELYPKPIKGWRLFVRYYPAAQEV